MTPVPGDTRENGFGECFVFERIDGLKYYVWDRTNKLIGISKSTWDDMRPVRSAKQEGLFGGEA